MPETVRAGFLCIIKWLVCFAFPPQVNTAKRRAILVLGGICAMGYYVRGFLVGAVVISPAQAEKPALMAFTLKEEGEETTVEVLSNELLGQEGEHVEIAVNLRGKLGRDGKAYGQAWARSERKAREDRIPAGFKPAQALRASA